MNKKEQDYDFEFFYEKKDVLTKADIDKMLKEIKYHLSKKKNIKVILVIE